MNVECARTMIDGLKAENEARGFPHREVLPFVVVRTTGIPPMRLGALLLQRSAAIRDQLIELETTERKLSVLLGRAMERTIGSGISLTAKRELIRVRRDIYNHRLPKQELGHEAMNALSMAFTPIEFGQWREWLDSWTQRAILIEQGEKEFAAETASASSALKRIAKHHDFLQGLAIASPVLSQQADKYIGTSDTASFPRQRRTELGLIRYLGRCAFKLSPFSSFMRTRILRVENSGTTRNLSPERVRMRRSVKFNRALIGHLAYLVAGDSQFCSFIPVCWNGTASREDGRLLVIRRSYPNRIPERMRVPLEDLISIPDTKSLQWLAAYLDERPAILRGELVKAFSASLSDPAQAEDHISKLVELGLLVQHLPLTAEESSGLDELISFLESVPSDRASTLRYHLETLRSSELKFPTVNHSARRGLLRQAQTTYTDALHTLGGKLQANWDGPVFFEDVAADPVQNVVLKDELRAVSRDLLDFWSSYGTLMDGNISFRETIRHLICSVFPGRSVPFLVFVDYWKKNLAGNSSRLRISDAYTPNPCGLANLTGLAELRREVGDMISNSSEAAEIDMREWALQHSLTRRVQELRLSPIAGNAVCFSSHCQPVLTSTGEIGVVLNTINNGPFRTLLRSCSALSPGSSRNQLIHELRSTLKRLWPDAEPCELFGHFDFNANLHPRITDRRIVYEGGSFNQEGDLCLRDLSFRIAPSGALQLIHIPSGTPVIPLDLGMMGSSFKPVLQHLLLSAGNADAMLHSKPFHYYRFRPRQQDLKPVEPFPRLTFGRVTLRRNGWSIACSQFSGKHEGDSDFATFLQMRRLQRTLHLPDEVFVSIEMGDERSRKQQRTRDKPQYVHFDNYFLVEVLRNLIRDGSSRIYCEELLPNRISWEKTGVRRPMEIVLDAYLNCAGQELGTVQASARYTDKVE